METMTPKQRWMARFEGRTPDRIPTDYWTTPEFHDKIKQELGCQEDEDLWVKLNIDRPFHIAPPLKDDAPKRHGPGADRYGVIKKKIDYGTGEYAEAVNHPLADVESVADIEKYRWPQADDHDYEAFARLVDEAPDHRIIRVGQYEPFLQVCHLRGIEQAFEDMVLNPEILDAILQKLFDCHYETNRRCFEVVKGKACFTYIAEDLGAQVGPLFGLEHYRRFLRDKQQKMADLARKHDVHIFYHTDGSARSFLPDLIDIVGIEVLNPIQWRCPGMEREGLVKDFGDKVIFHGSIDNQHTLAFGTVQEVIDEVKESVEIYSKAKRGWICAPCHNIQPVSPVANIVAMYETIHQIGGSA